MEGVGSVLIRVSISSFFFFYFNYLFIFVSSLHSRHNYILTDVYFFFFVFCFCFDGTESWPLKSLPSNMRETGARPLNIMTCKYVQLLWCQWILVPGICHWNRLNLIIYPIPHWMIRWGRGNRIKVWSDLCNKLVVCMFWTFIVKDWHLERDSFIMIWSLLNCRFLIWTFFFLLCWSSLNV